MLKFKKSRLILFVVYIAVMVCMIAATFLVSANYKTLFNSPKNTNSVVDFAGYEESFKQDFVAKNLSGEWEFFCNKWIISESYNGKPDGKLTMPGRWTGTVFNGEKLSRKGFASYRLTALNIPEGSEIWLQFPNSTTAYRMFINGQLVSQCGTMSKTYDSANAKVHAENINKYIVGNEKSVSLVVELGYTGQGGVTEAPWICANDGTKFTNFIYYSVPYIILGSFLMVLIFCMIIQFRSPKLKDKLSLPLFTFFMMLYFLLSKDMTLFIVGVLGLNSMLLPVLRFLTGTALIATHIAHLFSIKAIEFNKREHAIFWGVNAAMFITYFALVGTIYQIIPLSISIASLFYVSFKLLISKTNTYFSALITINTFLLTLLLIGAIDSSGLLTFSIDAFASFGSILILLGVVILNFFKARESQKATLLTAQLEAEVAIMKNRTLKSQIKPHFIFNSLSAIQDIYRRDSAEGEEMLSRFAAHLRANVDSDNKDLVIFKSELKNMLNYFELENLRHDKSLTLVLNVEHTDFYVPALSLQPFLENAVKYSETQNMENGHIEISSRIQSDGCVIIEVSDNGKGFDTDSIRQDAVGIKNATERLRYGINAIVTVKSECGKGTTVVIIIPKSNDKEGG